MRGRHQLAGPLQRQDAAVVGERVQDDRHVLPGLDHLVEIADPALAHRPGERAVEPDGLAALEQVAAGQVGRGQVVMAGDRVQPPAELGRHVGDEAGLAAAGRALEQQRQPLPPGHLEQLAFASLLHVERGRGRDRPQAGEVAHAGHSAGATPVLDRTARAVSCSRTGPSTA